MTLTGIVKEFQWTNPHAWIQVTIAGAGRQAHRLELRVWQPEHAVSPRLEAIDVEAGRCDHARGQPHEGRHERRAHVHGRAGRRPRARAGRAGAAERRAGAAMSARDDHRATMYVLLLAGALTACAQLPRHSRWSGRPLCPTGAAPGRASTGGFWETTPEQALEPPPPADSPRRHPPYTPKFEAIYRDNLARIAADRFPDPISICGTPAGWPRMLALPDAYEFVVPPRANVAPVRERPKHRARLYRRPRRCRRPRTYGPPTRATTSATGRTTHSCSAPLD